MVGKCIDLFFLNQKKNNDFLKKINLTIFFFPLDDFSYSHLLF